MIVIKNDLQSANFPWTYNLVKKPIVKNQKSFQDLVERFKIIFSGWRNIRSFKCWGQYQISKISKHSKRSKTAAYSIDSREQCWLHDSEAYFTLIYHNQTYLLSLKWSDDLICFPLCYRFTLSREIFFGSGLKIGEMEVQIEGIRAEHVDLVKK